MHGVIGWGSWIILNQVTDRMKMSDLKSKVPLYGAAFDYAISALQMAGLIRVVREGGEEYVELTDLGRNVKSWFANYLYASPWGMGWFFGGCGWRWWRRRWHWWDW